MYDDDDAFCARVKVKYNAKNVNESESSCGDNIGIRDEKFFYKLIFY